MWRGSELVTDWIHSINNLLLRCCRCVILFVYVKAIFTWIFCCLWLLSITGIMCEIGDVLRGWKKNPKDIWFLNDEKRSLLLLFDIVVVVFFPCTRKEKLETFFVLFLTILHINHNWKSYFSSFKGWKKFHFFLLFYWHFRDISICCCCYCGYRISSCVLLFM